MSQLKIPQSKKPLFFIGLLIFFASFSLISMNSATVFAAKGDSKASDYCSKFTGGNSVSIKQRAACHKGFLAGYAGQNKTTTCKTFTQSKKSACNDGFDSGKEAKQKAESAASEKNKCGKVKTYFNFNDICKGVDPDKADANSPIIALALGILNFLAFGVSLVVAGGIVYGGILYTTARDNSGQTQKAMTLIVDSVIGLVSFFFLWAIINFIVPGGLF